MQNSNLLRVLHQSLPPSYPWWLLLVVSLLLTWSIVLKAHIDDQIIRNQLLQEEIGALDKFRALNQNLREERQSLIMRMAIIEDLQGRSEKTLALLAYVSHAPSEVHLEELSYERDRLDVRGRYEDPLALEEFVSGFRKFGFLPGGTNGIYQVQKGQRFLFSAQYAGDRDDER